MFIKFKSFLNIIFKLIINKTRPTELYLGFFKESKPKRQVKN